MTFRAFFFRFLPSRILSKLSGALARIPLPRFLRKPILGGFARIYRIDLREVEGDLTSFSSLQAFFIRRLKEGARPVKEDQALVVSPVDGRVLTAGPLEETTLLPIKGARFTVPELLGREDPSLEGGLQVTLYLSPSDYHRIHAPISGRVSFWSHIPGRLLPVNPFTVRSVEGVFPGNERVVSLWEGEEEGRGLWMVLVGALNVGSIRVLWDPELETNRFRPRSKEGRSSRPRRFAQGEEAARFELGSTVVLLLPGGRARLVEGVKPGETVKVGEPLGQWIGTGRPGEREESPPEPGEEAPSGFPP